MDGRTSLPPPAHHPSSCHHPPKSICKLPRPYSHPSCRLLAFPPLCLALPPDLTFTPSCQVPSASRFSQTSAGLLISPGLAPLVHSRLPAPGHGAQSLKPAAPSPSWFSRCSPTPCPHPTRHPAKTPSCLFCHLLASWQGKGQLKDRGVEGGQVD